MQWVWMQVMRIMAVCGGLIWTSGGLFAGGDQALNSIEGDHHEIVLLRERVEVQQAQIEQLRKELQEQRDWMSRFEQTSKGVGSTSTASSFATAAITGSPTATAAPLPVLPQAQAVASAQEPAAAPLSLAIGTTHVTPVGFMDFTAILRSKNVGSGLGTNFAAIPFNNSVSGNLSEYRLSVQNSRFGARLDSQVKGFQVLGYFETDFLGYTPGNAAVTTNADGLRMRLYWLRLSRSKFEILAGQSWSLLTPNRQGISPLPGDLFLTQDVDPNIQVGLTWARSPQLRLTFHPRQNVSLGASVEVADQYAGGSAGAGTITFPSALAPYYSSQLNTGSGGLGIPTPHQDLIGKIAFDPKIGDRSLHLEFAALLRRFEFYNPLDQRHYKASGGGGSLNFNVELVRNLRLFGNGFYSDGGGRYIFGQGPDLIIRGDGSPSLIHAYSTVDGLEYQARPRTTFFAFYGGAYFQRNVEVDPVTGGLVGYGYRGSPSGHNRSIQEATAGFSHTFWRNPNYGALLFMTQYSYVFRHPWYVETGQPGAANLNMIYLNLRYTLPGAPPNDRR